MILNLPDIDLLLTYSYHSNPCISHGISGHLYEVLDYYFLLRKKYKIKVLIGELTPEIVINASKRYYDELNLNDFIFERPKCIKVDNFLLTDGSYVFFNEVKILGNKLAFSCGHSFFNSDENRPKNVLFLEDHRIYKNKPNSIDYVKKILPFKKPDNFSNRTFIHLTGNCRKYNHLELIEKYPNCLIFSDYLEESYNVTNEPISIGDFNKYIYTPITRKFDCSPRLIAECDYLRIPVEYYNIDYYDIGLETRKLDIKNKNYLLNEDDEIFKILKENLK